MKHIGIKRPSTRPLRGRLRMRPIEDGARIHPGPKGLSRRTLGISALALLASTALPFAALAVDVTISITGAWARPTLRGTRTGAAYMTLTNRGQATDRLLSLSTPIADRAELHEEMMSGGVMSMKPVTDLTLRPGASVQIDPGHYHIMLIGLSSPLVAGESFSLSLTFEKAGAVVVTVPVTTMPPH